MRKIIICTIASIFSLYDAQSVPTSFLDDTNKMYASSVSTGNLMKFEEVPISHYTGVPNISIPLLAIPTSNNAVNLSVSLQYHPLSAKPQDKSGEVGLGWNLLAGGTITKTVRGGQSDEATGRSLLSMIQIHGINTSQNSVKDCMNNTCPISAAEYEYYGLSGMYDTEYDLYQYSFMGNSGRFIVKKNSNQKFEVVKLDRNNLKILCNVDENNVESTAQKPAFFKIIDDKGIVFIFNVTEESYYNVETLQGLNVSGSFDPGGISAYHLKKVLDQNLNLLINFNYSTPKIISLSDFTNFTQYYTITSSITPLGGGSTPLPSDLGLKSRTETSKETQHSRRLEEIEIIGKGSIFFKYQQGRNDMDFLYPQTDLYKLTSIYSAVKNGTNEVIKEMYHLNYDGVFNVKYIPRLGISTREGTKLKLTGVSRVKSDGSPIFSYGLHYHDTPGETMTIDPWGYYKGTSNKAFLSGVLDYMILPTGGKVYYDYEENTYSHSSKTNQQDVTPIEQNYQYETSSDELYFEEFNSNYKQAFFDINYAQIVNFDYQIEDATANWKLLIFKQNADGNFEIAPSYVIESPPPPACPTCPDNNPDPYFSPQSLSGTKSHFFEAGNYYVSFVPKDNNNIVFPYSNYFVAHSSNRTMSADPYRRGGGFRIKSISTYEDEASSVPLKMTEYDYQDVTNPAHSSGVLSFPEPIYSFRQHYLEKQDRNDPTYQFEGSYNCNTNFNILPVQKTQGGDVGYKYVTVKQKNGTQYNGKTIYEFSTAVDYPNNRVIVADVTNLKFPIFPTENNDYKRGIKQSETVFNAVNDTLVYNKYEYDIIEESHNIGMRFMDFDNYNNILLRRSAYLGSQTYNPNSINPVSAQTEYVTEYFGTAQLVNVKQKEYFYNGASKKVAETIKDIIYNSNDLPTSTTTLFPDNSIGIENQSYATELGESSLISANMIAIPLMTETVKNTDTTSKVLTTYDNRLPKTIQSHPLGLNVPTEEVRFDSYDSRGNLTQYTVKNNMSIAVIWGYNDTQPIAKIEGATLAQINAIISSGDMVAASNTDANALPANQEQTESHLISLQKAFRQALPNYQVTTYTYNPLIGVTSITQPNGQVEKYIYDPDTNMPTMVIDGDGKILKQFKYNYRH